MQTTRYLYLLRFILALSDIILINLSFLVGFYLSDKYGGSILNAEIYTTNVLACNMIWISCSAIFRLYTDDTIRKLEHIYSSTWRSVALHAIFFLFYIFFSNKEFSRDLMFSFYTLMVISFLLSRFTGTALEAILSRYFGIRRPVAVLGMNQGALKFAAYLEREKNINFKGFLGEDGYYIGENGELLPAAVEQLRIAAKAGVKDVFVSLTPDRMGEAPELLREAEKQCVRLKFVPDLSMATAAFKINYMGSFPILSIRNEPLEDIQNRFQKRLFDIVFSTLVIVFVLSWLYPLLALIIKMQSRGPVLFKQLRSGRDNKSFWCYKFRSMKVNNDSDKRQASVNDDRVTAIGRFMRKTSLDELPQFFNVLMGDMSVVGPRPHMLNHTEKYRALIDQYMVRQFLKPGITGWAQVNGYRGETKEDSLMQKRVEYDIFYMESWSVMMDVRIVFLTIFNVFRGEKNAY